MFTVGALHRACFWLHMLAASLLLQYTLRATDDMSIYKRGVAKALTQPTLWYYKCYDHELEAYHPTYAYCDVKDKLFRIVYPGDTFSAKFNTFIAVIFFSYFSAFAHLLAMLCNSRTESTWWNLLIIFPRTVDFAPLDEVNYRSETLVRTLDYACTASVMIALFSVMWGAANVWGVIVSPLLLCFIVCLAFWSSLRYVIPPGKSVSEGTTYVAGLFERLERKVAYERNSFMAWGIFGGLSLLFFFALWFGVIKALRENSKYGEEGDRRGQMPQGVVIGSVFVLVTFSSFVVPYLFETRAFLDTTASAAERTRLVATYSSAWSAMSLVSCTMGRGAKGRCTARSELTRPS